MRASPMRRRGFCVACANLLLAAPLLAATYNEGTLGDLSNNQAAPTPFALTPGANSIIGTVGGTGETQDWVAITVPAGFVMTNYVNAAYAGTDQQGFTGFQFGPTFIGSTTSPGSYAGYAHFGPGATNPGINGGQPQTTVGVDLLPVPYMADNAPGHCAQGATGYSPPLAAGVYTFLIQQTSATSNISYEFDMNVSPAPEPASLTLLALAGGAFFGVDLAEPLRASSSIGSNQQ